MLPCVFKTKRRLSKEMNRVLYILHVPIHSASISFLRTYCAPGPERGVGFPFYLFPIVNPNDHEFPFSLLRVHRTVLWSTEMIFLTPFWFKGIRRVQLSTQKVLEGRGDRSGKQAYLYERKTDGKWSPGGWRGVVNRGQQQAYRIRHMGRGFYKTTQLLCSFTKRQRLKWVF